MAYGIATESGGSPDDRRSEATRILKMLEGIDLGECTQAAQTFVEQMYDDLSQPVSTKQLFWLRDIKSKVLDGI